MRKLLLTIALLSTPASAFACTWQVEVANSKGEQVYKPNKTESVGFETRTRDGRVAFTCSLSGPAVDKIGEDSTMETFGVVCTQGEPAENHVPLTINATLGKTKGVEIGRSFASFTLGGAPLKDKPFDSGVSNVHIACR
jgi:hypothetical protein